MDDRAPRIDPTSRRGWKLIDATFRAIANRAGIPGVAGRLGVPAKTKMGRRQFLFARKREKNWVFFRRRLATTRGGHSTFV